jgi:hypothetical protein
MRVVLLLHAASSTGRCYCVASPRPRPGTTSTYSEATVRGERPSSGSKCVRPGMDDPCSCLHGTALHAGQIGSWKQPVNRLAQRTRLGVCCFDAPRTIVCWSAMVDMAGRCMRGAPAARAWRGPCCTRVRGGACACTAGPSRPRRYYIAPLMVARHERSRSLATKRNE